MASIKKLKDEINMICYDLISESFTFKIDHPDKGAVTDKALREIIKLRNELIYRINNPEDKKDSKKLRAHFNKIRKDIGKLVKLVEDLGKNE